MDDVAELHLTQRELDIMSVLWDRGEATVTEVRDRVDKDLAYTSISSMIRTLEMKGYVSHRRGEGKTHVYFPVIEAEKAGESALGRVLDKIYGGSPIKLLAHLVASISFEKSSRVCAILKRPAKQNTPLTRALGLRLRLTQRRSARTTRLDLLSGIASKSKKTFFSPPKTLNPFRWRNHRPRRRPCPIRIGL